MGLALALRRRYGRAGAPSAAEITSQLRGIDLGPGGRAREVEYTTAAWDGTPIPPEWRVKPQNRQRLDHYGNSGEGWSESWYPEYADPMKAAGQAWLDRAFGPGRFAIDVNEKGFARITRGA